MWLHFIFQILILPFNPSVISLTFLVSKFIATLFLMTCLIRHNNRRILKNYSGLKPFPVSSKISSFSCEFQNFRPLRKQLNRFSNSEEITFTSYSELKLLSVSEIENRYSFNYTTFTK
jgi:hypothetical protein